MTVDASTEGRGEGRGDKRKAFRCPVYPPDHKATLLVNATKVPVQVLDESATGFGIRTSGFPRLEADDVVQLQTPAGLHEVGVSYVAPEAPGHRDPHVSDDQGPTFRIGLRRLKEAILADAEPWFRRIGLGRLVPSGAIVIGAACLLVLAAVAGAVFAVVLLWHAQSRPARSSTAGDTSTIQWIIDHQGSGRRVKKPVSSGQQAAGGGDAASSIGAGLGDHVAQFGNTVRRLPGAAAFVLSDVARELGLDAGQRQRMRAIVDATDQVVRQMDEQQHEGNRQQHARDRAALLEEARREALNVLTPAQRARWEALQK